VLAIPAVCLALPSDAQAIAELSRDAIEQGLGWSYTRARILGSIRDEDANVAVVRESDGLVAFGIMEYGDTRAHLVLLGVQPTRRRRGLGRHVLLWLEASALTAGIERVRVEVRADNPVGIAFYERLGYGVQGYLAGYYGGVIDAVRLEKRLGIASNGETHSY
jgi:ribosomal protein S18 acetylase RimI-like enzyme